jgi:hypothetical protein
MENIYGKHDNKDEDYCDGCEFLDEDCKFFICNLGYWDEGRPPSGHKLPRPQKCIDDDQEERKTWL